MAKEAEILKLAREALEQLRSKPKDERAKLVAEGTDQALLDLIERLSLPSMEGDPSPPSTPSRGRSRRS